jgi:hypothetical protein
MWNGSFWGWPGVGGVVCESVSVNVFVVGSYFEIALTVGVPA